MIKSCRWRNFLTIILCISLPLTFGCNNDNTPSASENPNISPKSTTENEPSESTANQPNQSTGSTNNNWPNLYGPYHSSVSLETGISMTWAAAGPKLVWEKPAGTGYSAPVVMNRKVVLLHRNEDMESITCFDANTGKQLWEHQYSTTFECDFEYSSGPYSTPAMSDTHVFAIGAQGQLHCLDLATGNVAWHRNLLEDYGVKLKEWPVSASPIVVDSKLIFNVGAIEKNAGIVALDVTTGDTVWEATNHDFSHTTPVAAKIHGKTFLFVLTFDGLVSLDPGDGKIHWQFPHRIRQMDRYNAVSPVVFQDLVTVVTGPNVRPGLRCVKIKPDGSYEEPWKNIRLLNSQYTNLAVWNGYLFGFTPVKQGGPELRCINLRTGKLAWKHKPELGRGNLLIVDNGLLILGEDGTLCSMKLSGEKPVEISRTDKPILKRPCYTSMALANGLLYARNEKQIICIDLCSPTGP